MKRIHVPQMNARYWPAITLASLFGTNMGDLYARESGLGLYGGLGLLAALLAAVFLMERRDWRVHELWYWLAIILIRTGATNIADFLAFRLHIPALALGGGLVLLLALLAGWMVLKDAARGHDRRLPPTGAVYWAAMITAGVLGTALGDDASHAWGEGGASLLLALLLCVVLVATRAGTLAIWAYWAAVATARTAGTAMGDWLAENHTLNLGLPLSTLLTGAAFVTVLLLRRRQAHPLPA